MKTITEVSTAASIELKKLLYAMPDAIQTMDSKQLEFARSEARSSAHEAAIVSKMDPEAAGMWYADLAGAAHIAAAVGMMAHGKYRQNAEMLDTMLDLTATMAVRHVYLSMGLYNAMEASSEDDAESDVVAAISVGYEALSNSVRAIAARAAKGDTDGD